MSVAWRVKRYYDPRVLVPVSILTETEIPNTLVCLSGAEVALIRSLLAYATRRITWVSEYHDDHYLAPTTAEWDQIQAFTADLEDKLMSDCMTPIVQALDRIDATLATLSDGLTPIEGEVASLASNVGDLLAPLECICAKDPNVTVTSVIDANWPDYPSAEQVFEWSTSTPDLTIPALVDAEACALAQCWYQAGFELLTEQFLPAWRFGFDDLVPAAAAAIAGITGGIALPVVIGVYALAELIQELLEIAYESAEANLVNWLVAHKEDIVCPLYIGLRDGGTGAALWQPVADDVVEPAGDLSAGDKILVNFWMGIIGHVAARGAQTANSAWYQSVPVAGFCDDCPEPVVVGSNWWALPISEAEGALHIDHPAGSYWASGCWDKDNCPVGYGKIVAVVFEIVDVTGCAVSINSPSTCGCPYAGFWGDESGSHPEGLYYKYHEYAPINHAEAIATLCPGATELTGFNVIDPVATRSASFRLGYDCDGSADIQIKYLVHRDTIHP
jgi:hypothetical protein